MTYNMQRAPYNMQQMTYNMRPTTEHLHLDLCIQLGVLDLELCFNVHDFLLKHRDVLLVLHTEQSSGENASSQHQTRARARTHTVTTPLDANA
jgi:hypothetical protein